MDRIIIKLNGVEITGEPVERKCTGIECWYDPHYRHWVLYPVDENGYQLDEATYGFGKKEAVQMKKDMEAELVGKIY